MKTSISTLLVSVAALSYLTGCGGDSEDITIPKSVIKDIVDKHTVARGGKLELDGSLSTDDVKIVKYSWMIDDKLVSNKASEELLVNLSVGSHKLCLITEDIDGKSGTTCKVINIIEAEVTNPTAIINNIPTSGWKTKCKITINANSSKPAFERTIKSYEWFKDGASIGADINQTFEFTKEGEHTIALEVTDDKGSKDIDTRTVQIAKIGNPTASLTLVNVFDKPIFSDKSNQNGKIWPISTDDTNLPYKSNYVFLSAEGSFDDCNLTDDNLSYSWTASIYNGDNNMAPTRDAYLGIPSCWHNKMEFRDKPMAFNGTQFTEVDITTVKKNDGIYKYPSVDVTSGNYTGWTGWEGWQEEKWEHVFLAMCAATINYTSLRITLTVKDNLHDTETTVTKIIHTPQPPQLNN